MTNESGQDNYEAACNQTKHAVIVHLSKEKRGGLRRLFLRGF